MKAKDARSPFDLPSPLSLSFHRPHTKENKAHSMFVKSFCFYFFLLLLFLLRSCRRSVVQVMQFCALSLPQTSSGLCFLCCVFLVLPLLLLLLLLLLQVILNTY